MVLKMTTRNHIHDNNKDNNNRGRVHIFLFIVQLIELAFDTVIVEESRGRLKDVLRLRMTYLGHPVL